MKENTKKKTNQHYFKKNTKNHRKHDFKQEKKIFSFLQKKSTSFV